MEADYPGSLLPGVRVPHPVLEERDRVQQEEVLLRTGGGAHSSIWWPGITLQIKNKRKTCRSCKESTPSQLAPPPDPLPLPDYPFQQVASDYFQMGGQTYLVIVDRFSGWPVVIHCGGSTGSSSQLKDSLWEYFAT